MAGGGGLGVVGGELPEGAWSVDRSHFAKPVTRATAALLVGRLAAPACERWGLPLVGVDFAVDDDGWVYVRDQPVVDPEEVRRRAPAAADTVRTRRWRSEAARWISVVRPAVVAELLGLQDEPVDRYDDARLADHAERAAATTRRLMDLHMEIHLTDMVPLGALLAAGAGWGLAPAEVLELMQGASPASAPSPELVAARAATAASGGDGIRNDLPEVSAFLRAEGHHLVSEPEVATASLHERRDLVEALLRPSPEPAAPPAGVAGPGDGGALRSRVPVGERDRFDELLADALLTYGLRDDNTRLTAMWPMGLVRRAWLEAGRRLAADDEPDDVFGLEPVELADALRRPPGRAGHLRHAAERQSRRRAAERRDLPPDDVGEWRPTDPALLSEPQRWLSEAFDAYGMHYSGGTSGAEPLVGVGVAGSLVTGPAVVASSPLDALDRIDPGRSILVVTATAPAYDAVLPLVAGLVVETGGLLCHAALAGRQLGLPVVVGVAGATRLVRDGDEVTVDPPAGRVRVSRPASSSPRG
ncbi:MAG TPA: PEP-utilizing enzyme [Acidimicrobiales bacterium]|nr:PEP-utilizing enzyme [Acidimicrobiales bacterium]